MSNKKPLIMIVEREEALFKYLFSALKGQLDADFTVATTARVAQERASERQPSIITINANYDDCTGFELAHRLKNDARTAHIPIFMITEASTGPFIQEATHARLIGVYNILEQDTYIDVMKKIM